MTPKESNYCYDEYSTCPSLSEHSCFKVNDTCIKSCGLCKGMIPKESNTCYNDPTIDCDQLSKTSCMMKNVIKDCRKACGRCGGGTVSNCYDRMDKCSQLATTRCNEEQIRINCMKSCKVCNKLDI